MRTKRRLKRVSIIGIALIFVLSVFSSIIEVKKVNAAPENEKIITAKNDVGEGIDKFNYYPENKWKAGPKIDEYFTTVDTRLEENNDVYYTIDFEGTGIEVYGFRAPRHSIVAFSIDGGQSIEVDTFAAVRTADPVLLKEYNNLSNGKHQIKVQATGKTNPSATYGDIQISYAKLFKPKQVASNVSFNEESASIYEGATYQVEYTTTPIDAMLPEDFKFISSNSTVATVDNNGLVSAVSAGKTEITGYSTSLEIETKMEITVEKISDLHATVVDSNDQYQQKHYQTLMNTNKSLESLWSWKDDKAISQIALLTGNKDLENVKVEFEEFKNNNGEILNKNNFKATFMKEVKAFIGNAGWYSYNPEGYLPIGPKEDYFDVIYDTEPLDIAKGSVSMA